MFKDTERIIIITYMENGILMVSHGVREHSLTEVVLQPEPLHFYTYTTQNGLYILE